MKLGKDCRGRGMGDALQADADETLPAARGGRPLQKEIRSGKILRLP